MFRAPFLSGEAMKFALLLLLLCGCGSLDKSFVKAVDSSQSLIVPRYINYVLNDPTLDEDTKKVRIKTAEDFQDLVEKAKQKVE